MIQKVIQVQNLKKSYPRPKGRGSFDAVKGISFEVEKGEIFGIIGPNGAGKTTTLEIIEGLKKQTAGKIRVLGMDNIGRAEEIKKSIGIQLQSSQYLHHLSLGELLDLFASLYGRKCDKLKILETVDLREKIKEEVKNLSGGQKQRFTIATSLVHKPQILFLDEPTTGLDPSARRQMWQLVKKLNAQGITIIITTHYMEEAEYLCHRVAIMDQGVILKIDEPGKLIDRLSETTQVSFFTGEPLDQKIFRDIPEIEKIYANFPKTIIEINSLDHITKILGVLKSHQINFTGFTVKTASLEDVYLDLTGKEYQNE